MILPTGIVYLLVSFILVSFTIGICLKYKMNLGLIADPNEDVKTHTEPIPIFGGVSILIISLPLLAIVLYQYNYNAYNYFLGLVPIVALGFYKDKIQRPFSPILQFFIQGLSSYFLYLQFISINILEFDWPSLFLFVLISNLLLNAYNFLDVSDGLAGSYSLVLFLLFGIVGLVTNFYPMALVSFIFLGSNMAFLVYNWNPAKLFMGDTGSYSIMFTLLFISITLFPFKLDISIMGFLMIFFVPTFELVFTFLKRISIGKLPYQGDANHASLLLMKKGWHSAKIAYLLILATVFTSGLGLVFFFK